MRVFIGIKIGEELQKKILEWEKYYKNLPVRWLAPENLHITLIPPWEENIIEKAKGKLESIKKGKFEIVFDKISFGPDSRYPRLIWAEGNLFHLTLARFDPKKFKDFPIKKLNEKVDWQEKVSEVCLFQSFPNSVYKILHKVPL
jgi:2'-5' RNA ligase